MARLGNAEVFSPTEIAICHVMSRVVRRCFLLGDDPVTGKNYDHRKQWIEDQLIRLSANFGIDLLCRRHGVRGKWFWQAVSHCSWPPYNGRRHSLWPPSASASS